MEYNIHKEKIKGILLDSGKVLNGPIAGHWFITPNFFKYIDEKAFKAVGEEQKDKAFSEAGDYISKQKLILNEEEEYIHFVEYYRIFSRELPQLNLDEDKLKAIAWDLVYNAEKYKFYTDAVKVIPELSRKYKLAVVSDAWPSLEQVFKKAGLREYFSSFIISSKLGVVKPDEIMYKDALKELKLSPEEVIFIDDSIKNCDGAKRLGITSFLLCRNREEYLYNKLTCRSHVVVENLDFLQV